ncbi:hypothetical protein [uncultured Brachyspira sp.]|uniref:hypothetical protein n=1 Tax=uncultured Brachyspira sp. TaxID=221953 RepID=UPI0025FF15A0|nr:hypothetical protein [uncultured Brachyspira sp.]
MKKYLFMLSFMLLVLFSEQECKGPDGDSKPTPFRKENEIVYSIKYDADTEGIFYSAMLFFGIVFSSFYFFNKKVN